MPQFDVSTFSSQLFWLCISWGILFLYLWKVIVPRMNAKLDARDHKIQQLITEAHALDSRADQLIKDYDQKLMALKTEHAAKYEQVAQFIKHSKAELESKLSHELDVAVAEYKQQLKASETNLLQALPEKLQASLNEMIQHAVPITLEMNDIDIKKLLEAEIAKGCKNV